MIELTCKVCDDETMMCDEGVVSVTCSSCVNDTINNMNMVDMPGFEGTWEALEAI